MFAPLIDDEYYPIVTHSPGGESEFKTNSEFGVQYNHKFWAGDGEVDLIRRGDAGFPSAVIDHCRGAAGFVL